jgi:ribosomal protein L37E
VRRMISTRRLAGMRRTSTSSISVWRRRSLSGSHVGLWWWRAASIHETKHGSWHMAFDRRAGGHAFDFDREVCVKCGMSREYYEDNGKPPCRGKPEKADRATPSRVEDE